jgi:hypothetical protein
MGAEHKVSAHAAESFHTEASDFKTEFLEGRAQELPNTELSIRRVSLIVTS